MTKLPGKVFLRQPLAVLFNNKEHSFELKVCDMKVWA